MSKKKLVPQDVYCDYCGRKAEFVDSKIIYGQSYGMSLCKSDHKEGGITFEAAKAKGFVEDAAPSNDSPAI